MLILDVLQWADEPSLRLLQFLAQEIRDAHLLVVGTYRDVALGRGHPLARTLAVVGREDTDKLVKPKAFIVLKDGYTGSPQLDADLKAFVKDKIAPYKYPRWIEFVSELPKTATGKIQRFKLRA